MTEQRNDLTRLVLSVLFIGALMGACFWILRPFLGALIWAIMIVVATWPMLLALDRILKGRRWASVTIMSVILLLVLVVPMTATVGTLVVHADDIAEWARQLKDFHLPQPPGWVESLPLVGDTAARLWRDLATGGMQAMVAMVSPYAGTLTRWLVARAGGLGALVLQFFMTVLAAAFLYWRGEDAGRWVLRFGARLGGASGENAIRLSGQAIRGVALGVVVTALVQSVIGGVGLAIAGVPFASVLTAVMFLAAVAQIGAGIVLVPPVIWLYWSGSPGWGTFLLVVTIVVTTLDNVLRPMLIKMGADLPLVLIFIGVIGGLIAFGLIGIFVGPVVLAVTHTLLQAWMDKDRI
ncbi:AI-2E family transporter YdiK [Ramlibacter sp. G-1-2-2]|uniref:AI-2E family transporter YdiK n=1 Tax=Ramlibacter agri TaxID=2728837 RepID=A0A848HC90_9BURK|nr:AI-2E family transporter YdiK [Ramlibacter agri]